MAQLKLKKTTQLNYIPLAPFNQLIKAKADFNWLDIFRVNHGSRSSPERLNQEANYIVMSTVLVVDDSPTQREIITDLLKRSGLGVMIANDGMEALQQVQITCPDLVVLDIVMPKMNGYEVCRRLKTDPKTQSLPVVMCSSKGEEFDRYWGTKQGADAYIVKPFQPKELLVTVKQLLRG